MRRWGESVVGYSYCSNWLASAILVASEWFWQWLGSHRSTPSVFTRVLFDGGRLTHFHSWYIISRKSMDRRNHKYSLMTKGQICCHFLPRYCHDCLSKHLYRIKILSSPLCQLCNIREENGRESIEPLNSGLLWEKYWRARHKMNDL